MTAPVAKLVTAQRVRGGWSATVDSVVVVRAAATEESASKVLTAVSPVSGSCCSIRRRWSPPSFEVSWRT